MPVVSVNRSLEQPRPFLLAHESGTRLACPPPAPPGDRPNYVTIVYELCLPLPQHFYIVRSY